MSPCYDVPAEVMKKIDVVRDLSKLGKLDYVNRRNKFGKFSLNYAITRDGNLRGKLIFILLPVLEGMLIDKVSGGEKMGTVGQHC
jgi:hypothetical protein